MSKFRLDGYFSVDRYHKACLTEITVNNLTMLDPAPDQNAFYLRNDNTDIADQIKSTNYHKQSY